MHPFVFVVLQVSVLAYALLGGVFLAFSDFIMRSLSLTSGTGGLEAMQVINREVFRWVFMVLFLGMAAVSLGIVAYGIRYMDGPAAMLIIASGAVYLIGCFAVTVQFNVPMNEALEAMETGSDAARTYWKGTYLPRWTFWNTVRASACALSSALLMFGLLWLVQNHTAAA